MNPNTAEEWLAVAKQTNEPRPNQKTYRAKHERCPFGCCGVARATRSVWGVAHRSTHFERKDIALAGLSDIHFEWLDLLTPSERESAGSLPIDSTLKEIPHIRINKYTTSL